MEEDQARFIELMEKSTSYTDDEIQEMRGLVKSEGRVHVQSMAIMRTNIEVIDSIRRFDKASGKLGNIILALTLVAVVGTLVQATFAVLSYYWPLHP